MLWRTSASSGTRPQALVVVAARACGATSVAGLITAAYVGLVVGILLYVPRHKL